MISPTIFLIIIITMIGSLKVFAQINVLTQGGPGTASYVMVYYIYQVAFKMNKFGYGSALSVILFLVIMGLTLALSLFSNEVGTTWNYVMAASVISTLPLLIVFFCAQKKFIESLAMSGIK